MSEDAELQAESAQIEHLLAELRELVAMPVWQRIEDVLRRIVRLYGAGLARAIAHARTTGATTEAFDAHLCEDELVASLLVLHGLHPLTTAQRVERALAALRAELQLGDEAIAIAHLGDDAVQIAVSDTVAGGALSRGLAEGMIRRVLEAAAPELTKIEITGLVPPRDPSLVQIRTTRPRP